MPQERTESAVSGRVLTVPNALSALRLVGVPVFLWAILTERDVMKAVAAGSDGSAPVADWMTRHPETIEPEDSTDHAASLMIHGGFRHLPVVLGDEVVGIVSIRDLMKVALDDRSPRGV